MRGGMLFFFGCGVFFNFIYYELQVLFGWLDNLSLNPNVIKKNSKNHKNLIIEIITKH